MIAKRFARSRRHDGKNIFSREHGFENFSLSWPELREAEHPFQRLFRLVHMRVHGVSVEKSVTLGGLDSLYTKILTSIRVKWILW